MTPRQTKPITVKCDKDDEVRWDHLVEAIAQQYKCNPGSPAGAENRVTRSSAMRDLLKLWDTDQPLPKPPQVEAVELAKVRRAVKR